MKFTSLSATICLCFLVLIGVSVRLPGLHEGIWLDEAHVYYVASANNLSELISRLIPVEYSPPLFYVLMHYWQYLAGTGEIAIKIPALVFGLALIPAVYWLAKDIGGHVVGLLCAFFVAVSPQCVFYSLECRAYSLATLLYCLATFLYCQIIAKNPKVKYSLLLSLCLIVILFLHYTGILLLASLAAATLILYLRKQVCMKMRDLLLIFVLPVMIFLPWLSVMLGQMHAGFDWTHRKLWSEWLNVFLVNTVLASPISFWSPPPVVLSLGPILCLLLPLTVIMCCRHKDFFTSTGIKNPNRLIVIGACFLLPAALEGYVTPLTDRYMVPFAPFAWILFSTCALAWYRYYDPQYGRNKWIKSSLAWRLTQMIVVPLALLAIGYFNLLDVLSRNKMPLSAARALSRDIVSGKFKNTIFILVPDLTMSTMSYYLSKADIIFPGPIRGCVRWDDTTPFKPAEYENLFKNPNLVKLTEQRIANLPLAVYPRLAMVRESCMFDTPQMPCRQIADNLQSWLKKTYRFVGVIEYPATVEAYSMLLFDRDKAVAP